MHSAPQTTPSTSSETPSASAGALSNKGEPANVFARIREALRANTPSARLPASWAFLGVTTSMRGRPQDTDALLRNLRAELGDDELLAVGLATRDLNGQLVFATVFADPNCNALVIRRGDAEIPAAIVTRCGVLSSPTPEWRQLSTVIVNAIGPHHQAILLSASDDETLLFHRLGLTFTPAVGLATISASDFRELFRKEVSWMHYRRFKLTIIGCDLARLANEVPAASKNILDRISKLGRDHRINPAEIFDCWMPSDDEFRDILKAHAAADRAQVITAIKRSLQKSRCSPAEAIQLLRERRVLSYGEARQELERGVRMSNVAPRIRDTQVYLEKSEYAFRKAILEPLEKMSETPDPIKRLVYSILTELGREWFHRLDLVRAAKKIARGQFASYPAVKDDEAFYQRLALADSMMNVLREARRK